jgi:hypothetical protein
LDENFNPISKEETSYATCNVSTTVYPNRNVTIKYLDSCSNSWKPISSVASSFTKNVRLYDNFDKGNSNGWIKTGAWNVVNGELNNSGVGNEQAKSVWNYWNGSSGENSNLEISVKLLSGNDVAIKILDDVNEYYLETNDSYGNVYLWLNGALKENAPITGIIPNQWNVWKIRQDESHLDFYINNTKLIGYYGVPLMNFGMVMMRTSNTKAVFDNVTIYSGSWQQAWICVSGATRLRTTYTPTISNWYYNYSSAEITNIHCGQIGDRCTLNSDCSSNFCNAGFCKCRRNIDCCSSLGGPCPTNARCSIGSCSCGVGSICPQIE